MNWTELFAQWEFVKNAPIPFLVALFIAAGLIWWLLNWGYGTILRHKQSQIGLLESELSNYREKLKGASPEEAKAKIESLEQTVNAVIGKKWNPLTKAELTKLSQAVASLPKRRIQVMYANQLGKELARSIADAFEAAGWTDLHFSEGGGLGIGIGTGRGNGMAFELKKAIEDATSFKVESFGPTEPDIPGIVFVSVGINTQH